MIDIPSPIESVDFRIVDDPVRLMALDVFICVLERSYAQNDNQRKYDQARRDGRELGDELEDGDESEKSARI